ncbi:MAG: 50S ribosomal protein L11 methyltransferase [Devosia sp.]|nr:50S ribosomal protein L11 methyltransferase [Devosia sp.]
MALVPVLAIPEIRLYAAHHGSGLRQLAEADEDAPAPYWAFAWGGGLALARHILDHPQSVAGRRVLDLGAGSGLVAIAAARAGARQVVAVEIDPYGVTAIGLNAAANGVAVLAIGGDPTCGPIPEVDIIVAGDVFYDPEVGERMLAFLDRSLAAGTEVLVGDPGRAFLPRQRLHQIAEYPVGDMGEAGKPGYVFVLEPAAA